MSRVRTLIVRVLDSLPDPWARAIRRALSVVRSRTGQSIHRDQRPIDLPGAGPVVLVDARGLDAGRTLSALDNDRFAAHRVVLMTDDPRVHEYRSGPFAAVEYLPASPPTDGVQDVGFARRRIDELRRVYRVESVLRVTSTTQQQPDPMRGTEPNLPETLSIEEHPHQLRVLVATVAHRGDDARILHRQIGSLVDAGCEVTYVAPEPLAERPELEHVVVPRSVGRRRIGAWWVAARAIHTRRHLVDLVLVHDLELVLPARIAAPRGRVVWDVHEDLVESVADRSWIPHRLHPLARRLVALTERAASFRTRLILAEDSYTDRFGPWPVVPNTTPVPESLAPYIDEPLPRLVYVGRISWSRGLGPMIEIGRRLRGVCTVELVGAVDADARTMLENAAAEGVVTWHGYRPNSEALTATEGALAGLSLLGTLGNFAGSMPTKIYEYMARGVPVITTPLPLAVDAIEQSGAGFVVDYDDVDAVIAATTKLLASPDLRVDMGERGYEWVAKNHDWRRDGADFVATLVRWSGERQRIADSSLAR